VARQFYKDHGRGSEIWGETNHNKMICAMGGIKGERGRGGGREAWDIIFLVGARPRSGGADLAIMEAVKGGCGAGRKLASCRCAGSGWAWAGKGKMAGLRKRG